MLPGGDAGTSREWSSSDRACREYATVPTPLVRLRTDSPLGSPVPSETEVRWSAKDGFEPSTKCGSPI
jgi:hypothetical protein